MWITLIDKFAILFSFILGFSACFFMLPREVKKNTHIGVKIDEITQGRGFVNNPEQKSVLYE